MDKRTRFQEEAINSWEAAGNVGTLLIYTGGGKTRCGVMAYERLNKPKTLVVTSRIPLIEQWQKSFEDSSGIDFMCIQSAYKLEAEYDLVIVDEAHRSISTRYREFYTKVRYKHLLCLTATLPGKDENRDFLLRVAPVVYEKKLSSAIAEKLVPKMHIVNISVPIHKSIAGKYKAFDTRFMQASIRLTRYRMDTPAIKDKYPSVFDLAKEGRDLPLHADIVKECKAYWSNMTMRKALLYSNPSKFAYTKFVIDEFPDRRWIVFCKSIAFAETLSKMLNESNISNTLYHSKMSLSDRQACLHEFSKENRRVLVSVTALNEGLDVQGIDGGICASGVSTELDNLQQIGRVIRPKEGKTAVFVNLWTEDSVERGWVEKKTKAAKLTAKWLNKDQLFQLSSIIT